MITFPETDLHRLRQMRDDLAWLADKIDQEMYRNLPYRHYVIGVRSTMMVVGSLIRNIEHQAVKS